MVESAAVPIAIADLRGRFAYVNQALADLLGYSIKELSGRSFSSYLHPGERSRIVRLFLKIIVLRRPPRNLEFRAVRKDGSVLHLMSKPSRFIVNGKTVGFQTIIVDITERKRAEQEVKRERDRAQKYLDIAGVVLVVLDREGNLSLINRKGCEILGYESERILGKNWFDNFVPVRVRKGVKEVFQSLMKQETGVYYENPIVTSAGEERLIAWYHTILKDDEGRVVGSLSSGNDITDEKHAEELLKESEAKFRGITERSFDIVVTVDLDGLITYVSPSLERTTSYRTEDILGKPFRNLFAESRLSSVLEVFNEILQGKSVQGLEIETLRKDGSSDLFEVNVSPIMVKGEVAGIQAVARDISGRKKMESELAQSNKRLQALLQTAREGIVTADSLDNVTFANKAFADILGYTEEELLVLNLRKLVDEQGLKRIMEETELRQTGKISRYELVLYRKDGEPRTVQVTASPLWNEDGSYAGALGIMMDITERKMMEDELKQERNRLEMVTKNIGAGVAIISKDYRTLWANRVLKQIFGDVERKICYSTYNKRSTICPECGVQEIFEEGKNQVVHEQMGEDASGNIVWSEIIATPIKDKDGNIIAALELVVPITERKQMEQRITESEERLRRLIEFAPDAIYVSDLEGNFVDGNKQTEKMTGYVKEELIGRNFFSAGLLHERYTTKAMELLQKNASGQKAGPEEFELTRKDGSTIVVEISAIPVEKGGKVEILGIARDITERKKIENALRDSEEKYRLLFDNVNDVVFSYDDEFRLLNVSPSVEKTLGYRPEELVGKQIQELGLMTPESMKAALANAMQVLAGKRVGSTVYEFVKKDGNRGFGEINSSPLIHEGRVTGIIAVARDITERKEMEDALRESEEKIRNVLQSSPDAIAVIDLNRNIVEINQAGLDVFGFASKEEAAGKSTLAFVASKDRERVLKDMAEAVERGSLKNVEYTFMDADGHEFPAEVSASLVRDASGRPRYFVTIVKNIAERKQMLEKLEEYSQHLEELVERRTRQLREAEKQLVKSERLAAIGEVAAMVGHDLRNPLTGISGATYYLKSKLGPAPEKKTVEMLELIEGDIQYSNKIITDLMDYSREIRLELAETDPSTIVKEALSLVQMPQNVQLDNSTQDQPKIWIDVDKMKRVFANLIRNAMDAMPQGGKFSISSKASDGNVEFVFTDTGIGMAKEIVARIWAPFFTTKAKGMGLGLAISKRHVEAHGGKISVTSVVGEGATFTVTVPIEPKPTREGGEQIWVNVPESLLSTTTKA